MIDLHIRIGDKITCSDTVGYADWWVVIDKLHDHVMVQSKKGDIKSINCRSDEAFFWYELKLLAVVNY
jgi:hypothetical protein